MTSNHAGYAHPHMTRIRFVDGTRDAVKSVMQRIKLLVKPALRQLHRPEVVSVVLMTIVALLFLYFLLMTPFSPYGL